MRGLKTFPLRAEVQGVRSIVVRAAVTFAIAAVALGATPRTAASVPAGMRAGIDVSHWQGAIDWSKVAATDVRFAILKATEGRNYVDPTYAQNVAGATANGIAVGAYHFAGPSTQPGDAAAEADHFVAVARNSAGDVLPALDIEHTGGLTHTQLQEWVKEWLIEVQKRLGVKPMIYTSPGFWKYSMGDTEWFADNGYTTLWVAHWGVHSPTVPANDWGGHGWTYWQWTDCRHVQGISGCVDGDRYNSIDLVGGEISQLTISTTGGGAVTGPSVSCGDGATDCSRLSSPEDSVTLTAVPDAGAVFLGWSHACHSAGTSPTCTVQTLGVLKASATFGYPIQVTKQGTGDGTISASPAGISCGATCQAAYPYGSQVTLTASPDSASGFGTWGGACSGSILSCDVSVAAPIDVTARFDAATPVPEDGPGTLFVWGSATDARALGGSYLFEHRAGAAATFEFTGGSVSWYTIGSPAMGNATVAIDGAIQGTFKGYAKSFRAGVRHTFTGLGAGTHTITITALGTKSRSTGGTRVAVDAIKAAGLLRPNPRPQAGAWSRVAAVDASDGSYVVSDIAHATASLRFSGTGVSWSTVLGPGMGRAQVWIDGKLVHTVDLSATSLTYGAARTVSGLTDGNHVARIVVEGVPGARGHGTAVAVDGWTVL